MNIHSYEEEYSNFSKKKSWICIIYYEYLWLTKYDASIWTQSKFIKFLLEMTKHCLPWVDDRVCITNVRFRFDEKKTENYTILIQCTPSPHEQ